MPRCAEVACPVLQLQRLGLYGRSAGSKLWFCLVVYYLQDLEDLIAMVSIMQARLAAVGQHA